MYLFVRAQGVETGESGEPVSQIGLAESRDGFHFDLRDEPILIPIEPYESTGCEDPRVVGIGGSLYMSYTAYDGKTARLALAVSENGDLRKWTKKGPVFTDQQLAALEHPNPHPGWCKSGAMLDVQVNGYYWMYFGDTHIWAACSRDLETWEIIPRPVLSPRDGLFDEVLVEPGPPPTILGKRDSSDEGGIWLGYNGARRLADGTLSYSFGAALLARLDPTRVLRRTVQPLFQPETTGECSGQVPNVVFGEGMVRFKNKWFLYYGMADTRIGVAIAG